MIGYFRSHLRPLVLIINTFKGDVTPVQQFHDFWHGVDGEGEQGRGSRGGEEGEEGEQRRGLLPSAQRLLLVAIPVQANQGGGSSPHSSHSGKSKN